ncbi:MAG: hypothetical protein R2881_06450 [Eubacteriales bacterium]
MKASRTAYPVSEIVRHEILEPKAEQKCVEGIFEIDDPNFGNLWTNIPTRTFFDYGFAYGDMVRSGGDASRRNGV